MKLEGQPPSTFQIIGNVVQRSLELLTLHKEENVQTINFGSTYYGTDRTECFLIYNNGPDVANFVVILEEGAEGQEVVWKSLLFQSKKNNVFISSNDRSSNR